VSEIMAAAGLAHGGFYAHLRSKDDVVAQAIGRMFDAAYANLLARTESRARDYIDSYSRPPTAWISLTDVRSRPRREPYTMPDVAQR
jgi:AcrR family transcriptional regulator